MRRFFRSRGSRRQSWCLNAGFLYGAASGMAFVTIKAFKYSEGGTRQDVPWAILIVLIAGCVGGFLRQLGRVLLNPRPKRHGDSPGK